MHKALVLHKVQQWYQGLVPVGCLSYELNQYFHEVTESGPMQFNVIEYQNSTVQPLCNLKKLSLPLQETTCRILV